MIRYLSLAEYFVIAELVTGVEADNLIRTSRVDLADSALHAPQAGFDNVDFYPELIEKAAVLCWRLARNHPLPDGNKRAAWVAMSMFIEINNGTWTPQTPDVEAAEATMIAVAEGSITETQLANWLSERISFDQ